MCSRQILRFEVKAEKLRILWRGIVMCFCGGIWCRTRMDGVVNYVIYIMFVVVNVVGWERMGLKCKMWFCEVWGQIQSCHVGGKKSIKALFHTTFEGGWWQLKWFAMGEENEFRPNGSEKGRKATDGVKKKNQNCFCSFFELSLYCFELIIPQVWSMICTSYLPDIRGDSGIKKGFVLVTQGLISNSWSLFATRKISWSSSNDDIYQ